MNNGEKGMALLISLMATHIRDAHTCTNGRMLGENKPISKRARIKAAADSVKLVRQEDFKQPDCEARERKSQSQQMAGSAQSLPLRRTDKYG